MNGQGEASPPRGTCTSITRGAAESLLAEDGDLPSGDELADQFEQFLARQRKDDQD